LTLATQPSNTVRPILIFGGTFDPPHRGHLELPRLAMQAIDAVAVIYVPAARSPLKNSPPTPARHRLAMLRLALEGQAWASICTLELDRAEAGAPSYTVDTLRELRQTLGDNAPLRLLMGADQVREFHRWNASRKIVELAEPLVMLRPPQTRRSLLAALRSEGDRQQWSARLLDLPQVDISASDIRRRLAHGQPITDLVPPAVAAYIAAHHLYR
jgi:nicotinate-nucleotide adenylyltransferase